MESKEAEIEVYPFMSPFFIFISSISSKFIDKGFSISTIYI